jgi:hypothetical protein
MMIGLLFEVVVVASMPEWRQDTFELSYLQDWALGCIFLHLWAYLIVAGAWQAVVADAEQGEWQARLQTASDHLMLVVRTGRPQDLHTEFLLYRVVLPIARTLTVAVVAPLLIATAVRVVSKEGEEWDLLELLDIPASAAASRAAAGAAAAAANTTASGDGSGTNNTGDGATAAAGVDAGAGNGTTVGVVVAVPWWASFSSALIPADLYDKDAVAEFSDTTVRVWRARVCWLLVFRLAFVLTVLVQSAMYAAGIGIGIVGIGIVRVRNGVVLRVVYASCHAPCV